MNLVYPNEPLATKLSPFPEGNIANYKAEDNSNITEAIAKEINKRVQEIKDNPDIGIAYEEVKQRMKEKYGFKIELQIFIIPTNKIIKKK